MSDPGKSILEKFAMRIEKMLPAEPGALLVALSGGGDSVALVSMLLDIKEQLNRTICCFHLDHELRGDESAKDASFVRQWCESKGIEIILEKAGNLEKMAIERDLSMEEAAREYRYACLVNTAKRIEAPAILTGHTLDDDIETFFLRLGTGSALKALSGIPGISIRDGIKILRPLLVFKREELRGFLISKGESWREDSSNMEPDVLRNKVRLKIIPVLMDVFERDIRDTIGRTIDNLKRESEIIDELSGSRSFIQALWLPFKTPWKKGHVTQAKALNAFHPAIRYKIILWALDELGFSIKRRKSDIFRMADEFLLLKGGKRSHHIGESVYLARSGRAFLIAKEIMENPFGGFDPVTSDVVLNFKELRDMTGKKDEKRIDGPGTYQFGDFVITVETVDRTEMMSGESKSMDESVEYFDPSILDGGLELVSGSDITGFSGSESTQAKSMKQEYSKLGNRMLVDKWVEWPVLKKNDDVIWIVGVSRRKIYKAGDGKKAVRIKVNIPTDIKIYI